VYLWVRVRGVFWIRPATAEERSVPFKRGINENISGVYDDPTPLRPQKINWKYSAGFKP